jgi:hypothetical protein
MTKSKTKIAKLHKTYRLPPVTVRRVTYLAEKLAKGHAEVVELAIDHFFKVYSELASTKRQIPYDEEEFVRRGMAIVQRILDKTAPPPPDDPAARAAAARITVPDLPAESE